MSEELLKAKIHDLEQYILRLEEDLRMEREARLDVFQQYSRLKDSIRDSEPKGFGEGCYHQFGLCRGRMFDEKWDSVACHSDNK